MAVDSRLLTAIRSKLGKSRAATYRLIAQQSARLGVRPEIAALEVASMAGVNFQRFASEEQLEQLRTARASIPTHALAPSAAPPPIPRQQKGISRKSKGPGKSVWIVHGRDD